MAEQAEAPVPGEDLLDVERLAPDVLVDVMRKLRARDRMQLCRVSREGERRGMLGKCSNSEI